MMNVCRGSTKGENEMEIGGLKMRKRIRKISGKLGGNGFFSRPLNGRENFKEFSFFFENLSVTFCKIWRKFNGKFEENSKEKLIKI